MGLYWKIARLSPVALRQHLGPQRLPRLPEATAEMDLADQVADFDAVGNGGDLEVHYATAVELIHQVTPRTPTRVLDIGSGTGRFALWLHRSFHCKVHGVDLSPRMVACAETNARQAGFGRDVTFEIGSAADLARFDPGSFDVSSCTLAAHHFTSLEDVALLLRDLDRITAPHGAILLYDLGRLKTRWQTERYCKVFGRPDLKFYQQDFLCSMLASFTPAELRLALPESSCRQWVHLVEPLCGGIQALLGFQPEPAYQPDPLPHFPDLPRDLMEGYRQLSGSLLRQLRREQRRLGREPLKNTEVASPRAKPSSNRVGAKKKPASGRL